MARAREPDDWARDRGDARRSEAAVRTALSTHSLITHLSDYTAEFDEPDFRFRIDGKDVRLEVKSKAQRYSSDYFALWPDVPPDDLFIMDETSYRHLVWGEGMGFVVIDDVPTRRWHTLGPWELCLGPRRRFERRGDRGAGEFLKGKLLLDLRTAAATTPALSIDVLIDVVRASRRDLTRVEAVRIRSHEHLPLIPKELEPAARETTRGDLRGSEGSASVEVDADPAWCGLDARLVERIKEAFGWDTPTVVQRLAFPPILRGDNVLVLAPTAGGKTEAGLLPLLKRLAAARGSAPSLLAVSPLKALLDDQLKRYRRLAGLVGLTAFAWHGDVPWELKRRFTDDPSTILLTTPESLETLLASPSRDHVRLFGGLQAILVDEVHAFVGTPRGAQLASLIERIDRFATTDIQRIGLSATVGNPGDVVAWLRGGSLRECTIVDAQPKLRGEQLRIETYVAVTEAVSLIGNLVEDSTALVFTRSRRRAEELSIGLGVPVHHGSVSGARRADTVRKLGTGEARCVVATATLEMGIDLGELDLVVHDGAPTSPGSYLQRLGRAGRRTGLRKMVFTVEETEQLLLVLGVLARARRGDLDPLPPRRGARLVLGQQALALAFERTVTPRRELVDALRWTPVFAPSRADIEATIDHLIAGGWLILLDDRVVIGQQANARFGGQRLRDLVATFGDTATARVVDDTGGHVGQVDWNQVSDEALVRNDNAIVLAGRPWEVVSVDRETGEVVVRPTASGRPLSWRGPVIDVERATWQAVREVLMDTDVPVAMDERAEAWLLASRADWRSRLERPIRREQDRLVVDSFAGAAVHRAVLEALAAEGTVGGPTLSVALPMDEAAARAARALAAFDETLAREAARVSSTLSVRHRELLPPTLVTAEAREFHVDDEGIRGALVLIAGGR